MRKRVIFTALAATVFLVAACRSVSEHKQSELSGKISVSGAFALYPLVVKWGQEFERLHPGVRVDVTAGGAGKGIADALRDNVNLGMVSRDVVQEEINQGAWGITVARDAVLPTVSEANPYLNLLRERGISKDEFYKIWVSEEINTWGDLLGNGATESINRYKRSDASGAAETWAHYLGKGRDDLGGIGVFGDPGLAYAVSNDRFGIGYNNIAYVYDLRTQQPVQGLAVIPIDLNADAKLDSSENFYHSHAELVEAIASKHYPSPPGRELYFISNGPPKDALIAEFFKWVLTDGQQYVPEMGYIRLSYLKTEAEVELINYYPASAPGN